MYHSIAVPVKEIVVYSTNVPLILIASVFLTFSVYKEFDLYTINKKMRYPSQRLIV